MENQKPPQRKPRNIPSHCKMTKQKVKRLKTTLDHRKGISQRALAKVLEVSQSTICRTMKDKTKIRFYKKQKAPKRTYQQKAVVRPKCSHLVKIFRKKQVVIDDESYFNSSSITSNNDLSGNAGFYSSNIDATPNEVKLKRVAKFEPKLLVWVALSPQGISKPFIVPSGQAINEDVYIDKCLRARLIPFLKNFHKNDEIMFWPDLASSHYSKKVQNYLTSENIQYVPKDRNIANCPELRPIEDFWNEMKRNVYDKCWEAENLDQLHNRIEYCFKKIDMEAIHKLGKATFTRVDAARRHGLKNL